MAGTWPALAPPLLTDGQTLAEAWLEIFLAKLEVRRVLSIPFCAANYLCPCPAQL
jgi:hypothetical protein